jgi:thiosulfate reductase cytochrome b subunit
VVSGHFRRDFLPVGPKSFWRDCVAALTLRLEHRLGEYNAVQRAFYWRALLAVLGLIVSGLAIWKPIQTFPLEVLFGRFQGARIAPFLLMSAICGFIAVHIALVALVPRTLLAMILARASVHAEQQR